MGAFARLLLVLLCGVTLASAQSWRKWGHQESVLGLSADPATGVVCSGAGNRLIVWQASTSAQLVNLQLAIGNGEYITDTALNANTIFVGTSDGWVYFVDRATFSVRKAVKDPQSSDPVDNLDVSPNGALLLGFCDGRGRVWRAGDGTLYQTLSAQEGLFRGEFSPAGDRIVTCASGYQLSRVTLWKRALDPSGTSDYLLVDYDTPSGIHGAFFTGDGALVNVICDSSISQANLGFQILKSYDLDDVRFTGRSLDRSVIYFGDGAGDHITLFSSTTLSPISSAPNDAVRYDYPSSTVMFDPQTFLRADRSFLARYRLSDYARVQQYQFHKGWISEIAVKGQLITSTGDDGRVLGLRASDGFPVLRNSGLEYDDYWDRQNGYSIAQAPGTPEIVVGSNSMLTFFNSDTGAGTGEVSTLNHGAIVDLAYTRDGANIAVCVDGQIEVYSAASRQSRYKISPTSYSARSVDFTSDSKIVIVGCNDAKFRLFNVSDGKAVLPKSTYSTIVGSDINEVAASADGKYVAVTGGGIVQVFNRLVTPWQSLGICQPKRYRFDGLEFSPGSYLCFSGGQDYYANKNLFVCDPRIPGLPAERIIVGDASTCAFGSDDRWVYYGGQEGDIGRVGNPYFAFPLATLAASPATLTSGNRSTLTITLSGPAPVNGAKVLLSSNSPNVKVPASVTLAVGSSVVSVLATTVPLSIAYGGKITASFGGVSRTVLISTVPCKLAGATVSPATVKGGVGKPTFTVTLDRPAPIAGATVTLSSSSAYAKFPATTLKVLSGKTTASVVMSTTKPGAKVTATLKATYLGISKTAALVVTP